MASAPALVPAPAPAPARARAPAPAARAVPLPADRLPRGRPETPETWTAEPEAAAGARAPTSVSAAPQVSGPLGEAGAAGPRALQDPESLRMGPGRSRDPQPSRGPRQTSAPETAPASLGNLRPRDPVGAPDHLWSLHFQDSRARKPFRISPSLRDPPAASGSRDPLGSAVPAPPPGFPPGPAPGLRAPPDPPCHRSPGRGPHSLRPTRPEVQPPPASLCPLVSAGAGFPKPEVCASVGVC